MYTGFQAHLQATLQDIKDAGLYKNERVIITPQSSAIKVEGNKDVINFCANNYLGLADNPELIAAAKERMDSRGYGMASVRFICGTQDTHKQLEQAISDFFGTEDTILYAACFDANGGLFEPLLTDEDAIISDALNHASIIDGVRLCKAVRYRYANGDMADLEEQLKKAQAQRFRIIATDGVFSMDGNVCPLDKIYELAQKYDALVMVDESHSAGVVGKTGHGVTEQYNLRGKIEIITGTLGKAFGGSVGGFTTGKREIIDLLRQRSRPYLFSNSIPPMIAAAGIKTFDILTRSNELQDRLHANTDYFVARMKEAGFDIKPTQSAICAVMLYDARLSQEFAAALQEEGIYVTGFYYPVVPKGQARIRVQLSAAHTREQLDKGIAAFVKVGKQLGVISGKGSKDFTRYKINGVGSYSKNQLAAGLIQKFIERNPAYSVEQILHEWNKVKPNKVPHFIETESQYRDRTDGYTDRVEIVRLPSGEKLYISTEGWRADNTPIFVQEVNKQNWGLIVGEYA